MTLLLGLLHDMLFAAIPAVGFALVFNVPVKALKYCAIGGGAWAWQSIPFDALRRAD